MLYIILHTYIYMYIYIYVQHYIPLRIFRGSSKLTNLPQVIIIVPHPSQLSANVTRRIIHFAQDGRPSILRIGQHFLANPNQSASAHLELDWGFPWCNSCEERNSFANSGGLNTEAVVYKKTVNLCRETSWPILPKFALWFIQSYIAIVYLDSKGPRIFVGFSSMKSGVGFTNQSSLGSKFLENSKDHPGQVLESSLDGLIVDSGQKLLAFPFGIPRKCR